jgi:hypothetical protein
MYEVCLTRDTDVITDISDDISGAVVLVPGETRRFRVRWRLDTAMTSSSKCEPLEIANWRVMWRVRQRDDSEVSHMCVGFANALATPDVSPDDSGPLRTDAVVLRVVDSRKVLRSAQNDKLKNTEMLCIFEVEFDLFCPLLVSTTLGILELQCITQRDINDFRLLPGNDVRLHAHKCAVILSFNAAVYGPTLRSVRAPHANSSSVATYLTREFSELEVSTDARGTKKRSERESVCVDTSPSLELFITSDESDETEVYEVLLDVTGDATEQNFISLGKFYKKDTKPLLCNGFGDSQENPMNLEFILNRLKWRSGQKDNRTGAFNKMDETNDSLLETYRLYDTHQNWRKKFRLTKGVICCGSDGNEVINSMNETGRNCDEEKDAKPSNTTRIKALKEVELLFTVQSAPDDVRAGLVIVNTAGEVFENVYMTGKTVETITGNGQIKLRACFVAMGSYIVYGIVFSVSDKYILWKSLSSLTIHVYLDF